MDCVHQFDLAFEPLKDGRLLQRRRPTRLGSQWANEPRADCASSNFHLPGQRLEVQIAPLEPERAYPRGGREAGLDQAQGEDPKRLRRLQRPALRWQSRSPPAPSAPAVAAVAHKDAR